MCFFGEPAAVLPVVHGAEESHPGVLGVGSSGRQVHGLGEADEQQLQQLHPNSQRKRNKPVEGNIRKNKPDSNLFYIRCISEFLQDLILSKVMLLVTEYYLYIST